MSEVRRAYGLYRGHTDIKVDKPSPRLDGGGGELKYLVEGTVRGRDVSLVERTYNIAGYIRNWKDMREAGLPVVTTLRQTNRNTILVTDVKADGSEAYGDGYANRFYSHLAPERPRPEIDALFLDVIETFLPDIEDRVNLYKERANQHNILIPNDSPFELVIHPDGSWDIMMLDLQQGGKVNRNWYSDIEETNSTVTSQFLKTLEDIRDKMLVGRYDI